MIPRSLVISLFVCSLVGLVFLALSPEVWHWFLIPVFVCGVIIGMDAADWLTGKLDVFDPAGVIGVYGLFFFFLAPLLHVVTDHWMMEVPPPPDWRVWLGWMAVLNVAGLLVYRTSRSWLFRRGPIAFRRRTTWQLDPGRFRCLLLAALLLSLAGQSWIFWKFNGLSGYIAAIERGEGEFYGMTWVFMFADSFPILGLIGYAVYARNRRKTVAWPALLAVLALFFLLEIIFGGLRGTRSNTVWPLFCAVGIIHFNVRRIPRTLVLLGVAFIVLYVYAYGFYKSAGRSGLADLFQPETRRVTEERIRRPIQSTLLDDFGRSDVQAYLLYRMFLPHSDYQYALGRTYAAAVLRMVPHPVLKILFTQRPPTKIKEGTEALRGTGSFNEADESAVSLRIYGLAGETMLNFTPWVAPLGFTALALLVSRVQLALRRWPPGDMRWLLAPWLVSFCLLALVADSDNLVYYCLVRGVFPALLLAAASRRRALSGVAAEEKPRAGFGDFGRVGTSAAARNSWNSLR